MGLAAQPSPRGAGVPPTPLAVLCSAIIHMQRGRSEMTTKWGIVAILLVAATASCGEASANPIIGSWKPDPAVEQKDYCKGTITFTAKTYTALDPWGKVSTIPVRYVGGDVKAYPADVYVITDAGAVNHTTYRFESHDRMVLQTAWPCTYIRG
jgi:hypothetical protein